MSAVPGVSGAGVRAVLLAAASGTLCFLGFVGFGVWPLALVCLIPFWETLETVQHHPIRRAAGLGFVLGFVAYAGGFHWIWRIVDVFLGGNVRLGALLWVADASWFALRFALYGGMYALVRHRGGSITAAGVPTLVVIEWLYPALFPVFLGHALADQITVIQISDLGGPLLLTASLGLLNVVAFATWRWLRGAQARPVRAWACAALGIGCVWAYGAVRIGQVRDAIDAAPALRVGVVQGNLGVFEKGRRAAFDHETYLAQTRELVAAGAVDLIVWPETVYTSGLRRPLPLSGRMIRGDLGVPLLFGAATVDGRTGRNRTYNSALMIGADGVIRDAYDKNILIPFTEYVPFIEMFPGMADRVPGSSGFTAGTNTPALGLGPWRVSTPICHEIVQAAFVRRMVAAAHPHLLATLANDSWFGDSQEPSLHLAMARMRAVEHRRYLVRATNSGISAIVDPLGREVARGGLLVHDNLRATVHLLDGTTLYTAWGDWPGWLAAALVGMTVARRAAKQPHIPLTGTLIAL